MKEVKSTAVQQHGKKVMDTVEPVPKAQKAQTESKKENPSIKETVEKTIDLGSQKTKMETKDMIEEPKNTTKESKEKIEESKEVKNTEKNEDKILIQEVSD